MLFVAIRLLLCLLLLASKLALGAEDSRSPKLSNFIASAIGTENMALPDGFTIGASPSGLELTWIPARALPIVGSRVEFRLASKGVLGYPLEKNGKFSFAISTSYKDLLATDGQHLEVWLGSQRIDGGGTGATAATAAAAAAAAVNAASYDPQLPATPTVPIDPAALGNYKTSRLAYNLTQLNISGFPAPVEVVAEVTHPLSTSSKLPLVLFFAWSA
jgi:hypothetical protein